MSGSRIWQLFSVGVSNSLRNPKPQCIPLELEVPWHTRRHQQTLRNPKGGGETGSGPNNVYRRRQGCMPDPYPEKTNDYASLWGDVGHCGLPVAQALGWAHACIPGQYPPGNVRALVQYISRNPMCCPRRSFQFQQDALPILVSWGTA
jgi:hypothetical protein